MTLYLCIEVILGFFPGQLGAGCLDHPTDFGWHDRSIQYIDSIEAIMIVVMTLTIVVKARQERKDIKVTSPD